MNAPEPARRRLTDGQRIDWLRLIRSENIGPRTFRQLLNHCGGAAAALDALPRLAAKGGRPVRLATRDDVLREMEATERLGGRFVCLGEPDYPDALRQIADAPPVLCLRGGLRAPAVAVVGSRNASGPGLVFTERLAAGLGAAGYAVVSGLARGIDRQAHRASLRTGTVAVLAGGLARIYPAEHAPLLDEIVEAGGGAVTEMPIAWEPRGRDFPRRNRIISGLSLGVVVVEAAMRSGSLVTARFAGEQGREVFAVPGSPLDPRSEGANGLIRDGATLCRGADDVIGALAAQRPFQPALLEGEALPLTEPLWDELDLFGDVQPPEAPADLEFEEPAAAFASAPAADAAARLVALAGPSPIAVDDLIRLSGLPPGAARSALTELELAGRVRVADGGLVTAAPAASGT